MCISLGRQSLISAAWLLLLLLLLSTAAVQGQPVKIVASDGGLEDYFGSAVAIEGDLAVVGCPYDDDGGENSGAAYVYVREDGVWTQRAKLTATPPAGGELFGCSVALSGERVIVGAEGNDDAGEDSGAAYIFARQAETFVQEARLLPPQSGPDQRFGHAVAIWQDVAMVGLAIDPEKDPYTGSAYVYHFAEGAWAFEATLAPESTKRPLPLDVSLALNGDVALLGEPYAFEDGRASGVVYVFRHYGGLWQQETTLKPAEGRVLGQFGSSVAVDQDTIVVGARGSQLRHPDSPVRGAVYVFEYDGTAWVERQQLALEQYVTSFGQSVAVRGTTILVGAPDSGALVSHGGAVYVYRRDETQWIFAETLLPPAASRWDQFGSPLAFDGQSVIAGMIRDDQVAVNAGAAYILDYGAPRTCAGDANGDGGVDADDLLCVLAHFGQSANSAADGDLDGNRRADVSDLTIVLDHLGTVQRR